MAMNDYQKAITLLNKQFEICIKLITHINQYNNNQSVNMLKSMKQVINTTFEKHLSQYLKYIEQTKEKGNKEKQLEKKRMWLINYLNNKKIKIQKKIATQEKHMMKQSIKAASVK